MEWFRGLTDTQAVCATIVLVAGMILLGWWLWLQWRVADAD